MRWCPVADLRGGTWSDAYDTQERTLHFENGSFVEFMSYDQDVDKFAGTSRHFVHFDEEPPQDIYIECTARLIDTKGSWWMTLTPVMGMEWMYDDIYIPGMNNPQSSISVIEVEMYENPHLGREEIQEFLDSLPEEDRDARIKGKFVRRGGIIYKAFSKMHIIEPLSEINPYAELYASLDHGFNNPTAWLWHLVDSDGNINTFMEHYEREMTVEEHAAQVHAINKAIGREPGLYIGDPAIAQRNASTGASIQAEYAQHGIYITLGSNEILNGINKINTYLAYGPGKPPRWHVTSNCENLIKEIQKYRWKTWANKKSERQNNDHATDSLRYFFTVMPDLTPYKKVEEKKLPSIVDYEEVLTRAVYDTNVKKRTPVASDWHIETADEFMGGEW
jgi:phage terminase large subunit-like protein